MKLDVIDLGAKDMMLMSSVPSLKYQLEKPFG